MNDRKEPDHEVLITRVIDAPREVVFRAWSEPAQLMDWYAPRGCSIEFDPFEFRKGGVFQSCLRTPQGHECWSKGVYREVVPPQRLEFSLVAANRSGETIEPADVGMDPDWPTETYVTVTFADSGNQTYLTLHHTVLESLARRTGAYQSWLEMLDRLSEQCTGGSAAAASV